MYCKKKLIWLFSFLVIVIFPSGFLSTSSTLADGDTLLWHECLTPTLTLGWKLSINQQGESLTLAGEQLVANDILKITLKNSLPTDLQEYNETDPLQLYDFTLNDVPLNTAAFDDEKDIYCNFFYPVQLTLENGTILGMPQIPQILNPLREHNVSNIYVSYLDGAYDILYSNSDTFSEVHYIVNEITGIPAAMEIKRNDSIYEWDSVYIEPETSSQTSSVEDDGDEVEVTLDWHSNIKKGTILGWEINNLTLMTNETVILGDAELNQGDILQFGLIANPPTDFQDYFEMESAPTNWLEMYHNGNLMEMEELGEQGAQLLGLMLPKGFTFENGSTVDLGYFLNAQLADPESGIISIVEETEYYQVAVDFTEEGNESTFIAHYKVNKDTGICLEFKIIYDEFYLEMTYYEEAANVDATGETKEITESEYDIELNFKTTGFTLLPMLVVIPLIIIKKNKK